MESASIAAVLLCMLDETSDYLYYVPQLNLQKMRQVRVHNPNPYCRLHDLRVWVGV